LNLSLCLSLAPPRWGGNSWGEYFPRVSSSHPTDEDLSVGTPAWAILISSLREARRTKLSGDSLVEPSRTTHLNDEICIPFTWIFWQKHIGKRGNSLPDDGRLKLLRTYVVERGLTKITVAGTMVPEPK